jgi:DNA-binding SARP family transcriptional activator
MRFHKAPPAARLRETDGEIDADFISIDVLAGRVRKNGLTVVMSPAELGVVIALAISDVPPSRDELADKLYPDAERDSGLNALKVNVHRARRRLGSPDAIYSDAGRYVLGWCVDVDVARVETGVRIARRDGLTKDSREALRHIRGRLRTGRPAFMQNWDWFEDTERRLLDLSYDVTMLLAGDALGEHLYDDALSYANEILRTDPLDEPAAEIAIRAFVQCGDRAGAIGQFRRYEDALWRELSEAPPESLRRLVEAATHAATAQHPASPAQTAPGP